MEVSVGPVRYRDLYYSGIPACTMLDQMFVTTSQSYYIKIIVYRRVTSLSEGVCWLDSLVKRSTGNGPKNITSGVCHK